MEYNKRKLNEKKFKNWEEYLWVESIGMKLKERLDGGLNT